MYREFVRYFFYYLLRSKTRQRLLLLAVVGLFLSSFALIVMQSTMGGLQRGRVNRSKDSLGHGEIYRKAGQEGTKEFDALFFKLKASGLPVARELRLEMMVRSDDNVAGAVVHGIFPEDFLPQFLRQAEGDGAWLPHELAFRLKVGRFENIVLYSPTHFDSFLGDVPRHASTAVTSLLATDDPEVDGLHLWVRLAFLQNLIRQRSYNLIKIFEPFEKVDIYKLMGEMKENFVVETWEEKNSTLVWSLNLEGMVMLLLFVGMSLLVSLCITSGLLIFFSKIKADLSSFWILGASKKKLENAASLFLSLTATGAVASGLLSGLLFLWAFDRFGGDIMPAVFVDRKIPVYISLKGILISFLVPYCVSWIFSRISIRQFKKEENFLEQIRSFGL